jgi:antitoxin ParD1/3/4
MATMNVSLTEDLKEFVEQQVQVKSFTSTSEYLRQLIREDRELENFKAAIDAGASAPIGGVADAAFFNGLRKRAKSRTTSSKFTRS